MRAGHTSIIPGAPASLQCHRNTWLYVYLKNVLYTSKLIYIYIYMYNYTYIIHTIIQICIIMYSNMYRYIYIYICKWKHYLHIIRRQVTAPSMAAACMAACRRTCAVGTEYHLVTHSWLLNYGHWVVDLPNLNIVIFHSSVTVYQRVNYSISSTWNKASYGDDPSYYQWGHSEVTVRSL